MGGRGRQIHKISMILITDYRLDCCIFLKVESNEK
jgi:hypothetical protein